MSRRVTLPGADELFRATSASAPARSTGAPESEVDTGRADPSAPAPLGTVAKVRPTPADADAKPGRPTGRERHDEKITVYVSPEELIALEHARLNLRARHGLAVDRGRIVREAVAVVLADLEAKGADSILVRRLRNS